MNDDLDQPNIRSGYCPVCGMPANIWCSNNLVWHCCFCNWSGKHPDRTSKIKREEYTK